MSKSNSELVADITTDIADITAAIPDNPSPKISPARVRTQLLDTQTRLLDMLAREGQANGSPSLDVDGRVEQPAKGYAVGLVSDGAVSDSTGVMTGTAAQSAIQSVIDAHMYDVASDAAMIPAGDHRLTTGLHLGYGVAFRTGRLLGAGRGYGAGSDHAGTTLFADFVDQPGISVQGARNSELGQLSINGRLRHYILTQNFGDSEYAGVVDDTVAANWVDPSLSVDEIALIKSVSAPYAGVAIDPRSGTAPTPHYADVAGLVSQYSKGFSSNVELHRLEINGFYVGVIVQPNSLVADGNGDFVCLRQININACPFGVAIVQTQARCSSMIDVFIARCHTGLTNKIFGLQQGKFGDGFNLHIAQCINLYDFSDSSILGDRYFQIYGESVWREGNILNTTAAAQQITIRALINFGQNARRGVSATMLTGGVLGPIKWDAGVRNGFYGFFGINHAAQAFIIDGTEMTPAAIELDTGSAISLGVKAARNATAGGLYFPELGQSSVMERKYVKFTPWNLDTGSVAVTNTIGNHWLSNRSICTPLWVEKHSASAVPLDPGVIIPRGLRVTSATAAQLGLSGAVTSRVVNGTFPVGWTAIRRKTIFGQKGDILVEDSTMCFFVLESVSGDDYVLSMQTGWQGTTPIAALNLTGKTFSVACSRWYSPAVPVYGKFTSGSAIITEVGTLPSGAQESANIDTNIGATDTLMLDEAVTPFVTQVNAVLTARDNAAATITLTGNAIASSAGRGLYGVDRIRLGTFARVLS